jgi:hypothetical protein
VDSKIVDLYHLLDHVVYVVGSHCFETVLENAAKEGNVVAAQFCIEDGSEEVFLLRALNDTNKAQRVLDFCVGKTEHLLVHVGLATLLRRGTDSMDRGGNGGHTVAA